MPISSYQSEFGASLACWNPAAAAAAAADASPQSVALIRDRLGSHAAAAAIFGVERQKPGDRRSRTSARRARSAQGGAARSPPGIGKTRYVPFVTPEQKRGKHSGYPVDVTEGHLQANPSDAIGFERSVHLRGMANASGPTKAFRIPGGPAKPATRKQEEVLHHLDPFVRVVDHEGPRGRACRFPCGGYALDALNISPLEPGPESFVPYWDRETPYRGKSNKYPRELDPYPSSVK